MFDLISNLYNANIYVKNNALYAIIECNLHFKELLKHRRIKKISL